MTIPNEVTDCEKIVVLKVKIVAPKGADDREVSVLVHRLIALGFEDVKSTVEEGLDCDQDDPGLVLAQTLGDFSVELFVGREKEENDGQTEGESAAPAR